MKPLRKNVTVEYPTLQQFFKTGVVLLMSSCASNIPPHHNAKYDVPGIETESEFDCPSSFELQEYRREKLKTQRDVGITLGDITRLEGIINYYPINNAIPVTLKDNSRIGYSLKIEYEKPRDGEKIKNNIVEIVSIITNEITEYIPNKQQLPKIQDKKLRTIVERKIEDEFYFRGWVRIEIQSACDLYAYLR